MFKIPFVVPRLAAVVLLSLLLGTPNAAHAATGLKVFLGKYHGKYTGVVIEASGETSRALADAATKVTSNGKSAKFVITGTMSGVGYSQTITLRGGKATVSALIPGGSGNLAKSAQGTYKARGKNATLTFVNPGGIEGRMQVKIGFVTGGSTLIISTVIIQQTGDPIYSTVTGA